MTTNLLIALPMRISNLTSR